MTDENLVLEHLKAIRNEIRDHKRSTDAGFKDLRSRMTGIETRLVGLELHAVSQHGDAARHESRFEEMEDRIQKIERRLEIADK